MSLDVLKSSTRREIAEALIGDIHSIPSPVCTLIYSELEPQRRSILAALRGRPPQYVRVTRQVNRPLVRVERLNRESVRFHFKPWYRHDESSCRAESMLIEWYGLPIKLQKLDKHMDEGDALHLTYFVSF